MAKSTERSVLRKAVGRRKQSESCTECIGAPPIENFSLQGLEGTYCTKCHGVLSWNKVGQPIEVQEKKVVMNPTIGRNEVVTANFIPGNQPVVNFNDLII